ncbi:MAG: hypothetical protein HFI28_07195, partial [Lachnospiraceae bacterium]|nr:hypothetical protein [Lachnospiraceae bacterium]
MRRRKTKIICTLGPASESEQMIRELMLAGMNVARLNFSHGTYEEQKGKIELVKKVREELKLPVALLLDTKGPEIRTRDVEGGKIELKKGQSFVLTLQLHSLAGVGFGPGMLGGTALGHYLAELFAAA